MAYVTFEEIPVFDFLTPMSFAQYVRTLYTFALDQMLNNAPLENLEVEWQNMLLSFR